MSGLVLDASMALAWCFEDEADAYADAVLDSLRRRKPIAPGLWALEVANALLASQRRGRIRAADRLARLAFLADLDVNLENTPTPAVFGEISRLADAHDLSVYDAAYLELAIRRSQPLATQDQRLRAAARARDVLFDAKA